MKNRIKWTPPGTKKGRESKSKFFNQGHNISGLPTIKFKIYNHKNGYPNLLLPMPPTLPAGKGHPNPQVTSTPGHRPPTPLDRPATPDPFQLRHHIHRSRSSSSHRSSSSAIDFAIPLGLNITRRSQTADSLASSRSERRREVAVKNVIQEVRIVES